MKRLLLVVAMLPSVASAQGTGKGAAEGFQSPSGNIHCAQFEGDLTCQIAQYTYRPPQPRGRCEQDFGGAVLLGPRGGPRLTCHGDTVADPSRPVLRYGSTWEGRGFRCTSSEAGVSCRNGEGRGFDLSRARLNLF